MRPNLYLSANGEATEPRLVDTRGALDFAYSDITKAGGLTSGAETSQPGALRIGAPEPAPRDAGNMFRTDGPDRLFFLKDDDAVALAEGDGALIGEEGPDRLIFMNKNGEYALANRSVEENGGVRIGGQEVFAGADQTVVLAYTPTADDFLRSSVHINGEDQVPEIGLTPFIPEGFATETPFDFLLF